MYHADVVYRVSLHNAGYYVCGCFGFSSDVKTRRALESTHNYLNREYYREKCLWNADTAKVKSGTLSCGKYT